MSAASDKRALIVKLGAIGDVVMAVPAVHALHRQGFAIDWICGRAALPVLECYSWIHAMAADDKAILLGGPVERLRGIAAFWATARGRYDLCATLYYDRRYGVLTWPVRARRKVKLSRESRFTQILPGRHYTDELTRILLEQEDSCRDTSTVPVRPDRLPPSSLPARVAERRIAIVPGGASNLQRQQILRRWPVENYSALTRRLLERGWEVVLLGGPDDAWVRPQFEGLPVTDCIGTLSLGEVISVCDSCDAVVSHDTGPMHLAGLSETALIGIFGPTDPGMLLPRRDFAVAIRGGEGFACRPCYDGRGFAPCRFNGCMHQVTVEMLLGELDRVLEARARGGSSAWRVVVPAVG